MTEAKGRRGGRAARRALRAAPVPEHERAVRPGMESGRYKPLSGAEVQRIHNAALHVLEEIGLKNAPPSAKGVANIPVPSLRHCNPAFISCHKPDGTNPITSFRLECQLNDGVVVKHLITAETDHVDFQVVASNPTDAARSAVSLASRVFSSPGIETAKSLSITSLKGAR